MGKIATVGVVLVRVLLVLPGRKLPFAQGCAGLAVIANAIEGPS